MNICKGLRFKNTGTRLQGDTVVGGLELIIGDKLIKEPLSVLLFRVKNLLGLLLERLPQDGVARKLNSIADFAALRWADQLYCGLVCA